MKVCLLTRISSPAPEISPNVLLHEKSIPVPPWPNGTHAHFGRQNHSGIIGVFDWSEV